MTLIDKPCLTCGGFKELSYYDAPLAIALAYKHLMNAGAHYKAAMLLSINKNSFNCFCARCWVDNFTKHTLSDDTTTDAYKINAINKHLEQAMHNMSPSEFWKEVGGPPELN